MLTPVDPIEAKLERLEANAPLRLDDVDLSLRDRHAVRARLAAPLAYSQRVEAMVTGLSTETLLPRAATETGYINRFLSVDDRRLRPFVQASFARCTTAE